MKLLGYVDDGLNWLIVNVFEKLPTIVNILILALVLVIIFKLWKKQNEK